MNFRLIFLLVLGGCCTAPIPFECPDRVEFAEYSQTLWDTIPQEAQLNINADDLAMKSYIKQCEARQEIHNR